MNIKNFTIKAQEVLQHAQELAQGFGHQQVEIEHIFKAMLEQDQHLMPYLLKKVNVNLPMLEKALDSTLQSFSKVSGGELMFGRETVTMLNDASLVAKNMKDEFVTLEHLLLAVFQSKSKVA